MSTHVLELNDCELRVGIGPKVVARSPGIAVILDEMTYLGTEAQKRAHLYPRQAYSRFWTNLNQDALVVPSRRDRHHADIAYEHLKSVHEQAGRPAEMILAVPGSWSNEQLSLLLGIAQATPFKAVGLVDGAVAAAAGIAGPGRWLHVEMFLHQTVLTRLAGGEDMARESVETLDNGGLTVIHETVAALIADLFIKQCRFDPLHHAETEQALYDQIPGCLLRLSTHTEAVIEIKYRDTRKQVQLDRKSVLGKLDDFYQGILRKLDPDRPTLLGDRIATLPGFSESIPRATRLAPDAVFRGCLEHRATVLSSGPHLNYVTRLPLPASPALDLRQSTVHTSSRAADPIAVAATHLLLGYQLFPLQQAPIYLSTRGSVYQERNQSTTCAIVVSGRYATLTPMSDVRIYVNGEPVTGTRTLHAGDKLSFAGSDTVYSLVAMAGPDAA